MTLPGPDTPEILDLCPFSADPLILGRLRNRFKKDGPRDAAPIPVYVVALLSFVSLAFLVSWSAGLKNHFYQVHEPFSLWSDIKSFILRQPPHISAVKPNGHHTAQIAAAQPVPAIPFLRDYPSMVLAFAIAIAPPLVYALFLSLERLHSSLRGNECIRVDGSASGTTEELNAEVVKLNSHFETMGRFWYIAVAVSLLLPILVQLLAKDALFGFLVPNGTKDRTGYEKLLFRNWWASMSPFRVGAAVWTLAGALGIYIVYVEAVVGISYARFLRRYRSKYQFIANPLNPDGVFGWRTLRQAVTAQQLGVVSSAITAFALSYYAANGLSLAFTAVVLVVFLGIVLYVFVASMRSLRHQVRDNRQEEIMQLHQAVAGGLPADPTSLLKHVVAYQRIQLWGRVPAMPLQKRTYVLSLLVAAIPAVAEILLVLSALKVLD